MVAPWIEAARRRGVQEATARKQEARDLVFLKSQPATTPEQAILFTDRYTRPVSNVVADLENAGGIRVVDHGNRFRSHGETSEPGKGRGYLDRYSLTKLRVERSSDPYSSPYFYNDVFGKEWRVGSLDELDFMGIIQVFPLVGRRTQLGGAEYRVGGDPLSFRSEPIAEVTSKPPSRLDLERVEITLQEHVGKWVEKLQLPRVIRHI